MLLLLSVGNVLTGGFQLSAQEQSKRFSVKVDNITLKEAIEVIKKQGNYSFLIRNNDIDLNRKVSVNINNGTINDVMGQLLAGTDVSYEVNGPRVIMFHAVTPQKEQEKVFVLKGRITDPTGEGVIGANVKVVDSTEGTITDMDGNFSLMVTPNARLSISYIGYATQEVVVKDQRPLNVTLKEDTRLIDEVVVVGYSVQKKANLTGAVSSVKMDDVLGDRPVVSVSDALKGAMPGLQITGNSGRPGEEMSFNIRGVNSLDKNGKPLVLVDNVEMDINMLDPNYNAPMTAFGRYMRTSDNLFEEGFAGYMKKIRIWKSAKDNEYVQNSYNGTAEVTGKEADLAAAWDFMTKPSGSGNEVIDLTGRHTAKIIGTYEWQRIVE